jgi:hypothetical protein
MADTGEVSRAGKQLLSVIGELDPQTGSYDQVKIPDHFAISGRTWLR